MVNLNMDIPNNQSSKTYQVVDEDSDQEPCNISNVRPSFGLRNTQLKREEIKNNLNKGAKKKDPEKKYKRILKRVKIDGRESMSSMSSLQSDYKTIRSDDEDRPSVFVGDEFLKISEKSENSENDDETYNKTTEPQQAQLPKRSIAYRTSN